MTDGDRRAQPDVLCFAGQDWWYHNRAHSDFQLMLQLAKTHRVLLVNSIGMRMPSRGKSQKVLQKIWRKLKSILRFLRRPRPDLPNFHVLSPLVFPAYGVPWLRGFAAWLVRAQVRAVAWWIGVSRPAVVITVPTAWDVVRRLPRQCVFYNRSDKHSDFKEADNAFIASLEHELFAHADHTLYVSETLLADEAEHTGERAVFLDHGVDLERFSADGLAEPADLAAIPRPRVGFLGGLRDHLVDMPLLAAVARALPDVQLVLVGDVPGDVGPLDGLPNVHFLGFKDHAAIPAYGAWLDVGLMPYRDTPWIRACNPIKLKEYLALGLEVVSTDFPAARRYAAHIAIAAGHAEFVAGVQQAVAVADEGRRAERRVLARRLLAADTWAAKAEVLERLMQPGAAADSPRTTGKPRGTPERTSHRSAAR
ncbi:MAG: glycosyltransferase [Planctomycetes bacterium]|nr:glycosyltransferase [Planctomycetota bacterium]